MELKQIVGGITPASAVWRDKADKYLDTLAIPRGSLGDLLELASRLASIFETLTPSVSRKAVVTMAGDHGVVEEGVSAFPQEVTPQMVQNFIKGGAAINILAGASQAEVLVADMGVKADLSLMVKPGRVLNRRIAPGTNNMAKGPAMTRDQAVQALETGIEIADTLISGGVKLLGTGDMGIGNTTPSSAILSVLGNIPVREAVGRGTGIGDAALEHKIKVIERAIALNAPDPEDAVDVLAKVGGFEIGGIAGLILGAAYRKVPCVVDGFISTAGAMIARKLAPLSMDYMISSHLSAEGGHQAMLRAMGMTPLLNLNLRLGEGTGAAIAMHVVECAAQVINRVLTFEKAGVTKNE